MKKIIYSIVTLLAILGTTTSCNKWLNVTPETKLLGSNVFTSAESFEQCMIGCYLTMTEAKTYGAALTMFEIDLATKLYTFTSTDASENGYNNIANCAWSTSDEGVNFGLYAWTGLYNVIVNINAFTSELEKTDLLSDVDKNKLFAEAYTMRAFCHFDVLRLFGPAYLTEDKAEKLNTSVMPYVTVVDKTPFARQNVREILDAIHSELDNAIKLYDSVPADEQDELNQGRFSKWAAHAIKARAYMWEGEYAKAITPLEAIIDSNVYTMLADDEGNYDYVMKLDAHNLFLNSGIEYYLFVENPGNSDNASNQIALNSETFNAMVEPTNVGDPRTQVGSWWQSSGGKYITNKYGDTRTIKNELPLIRYSEIIYMYAEALERTGSAEAANVITQARADRGITAAYTGSVIEAIVQEYYKELFGDGQLFYLFKRGLKNSSIGGSHEERDFVLPIPQEELGY